MRYTFTVVAALIAAGGSLMAQTKGLVVKKGSTYSFTSSTEAKITQVLNGQESSTDAKSEEQVKLTPTKIASDKIEWSCAIFNDANAKQKSAISQKLVTDVTGKILALQGSDIISKGAGSGLSLKLGSTESRLRRFFMPKLAAGAKVGESWEENLNDTTSSPEMGLQVRMHITLRYTFEGYADTLGAHAARIRWEATSIDIDGDAKVQGTSMTIVGGGTSSGVSYFSTADGMLMARTEEVESQVRVTLPQMVIPVVQQQKTTTLRAKS